MQAPMCKACGKREWKHVCSTATNTATNKPVPATNTCAPATNSATNAHQRWGREKYNAYQREYMRAWRALRVGWVKGMPTKEDAGLAVKAHWAEPI